jgi:hypothetical protein
LFTALMVFGQGREIALAEELEDLEAAQPGRLGLAHEHRPLTALMARS